MDVSQRQLRALSAHLESIREEERARIAREVHDELGQSLTALKMDLSWMSLHLSEDQRGLRRKAQEMIRQVKTTVRSVQRIAADLRPRILDDAGLVAAIEWQLQEFKKRSLCRCAFSSSVTDQMLDPARSTTFFRILQEALTNVARHAHASLLTVHLIDGGDHILMIVKDNGRGIPTSKIHHPGSLGLIGMRERALVFGGTVEIARITAKGTSVTVKLPKERLK